MSNFILRKLRCEKFETVGKILVIRLSSLGDVLLTTPVLRAIKQKFANSEIHFLVKQNFADAVNFNPNLNKIYIYDVNRLKELKNDLKSEGYDFIADLQNNFRSRSISRSIAAKTVRYSKPAFKKFLLVNFKINLLKEIKSIPQRYAESINGLKLDSKGLELHIPENIKSGLTDSEKYIGLCPGSQHFTKRWPPEYFVDLGNKLVMDGYRVVLFGGKNDKLLCDKISLGIENCINLQNEDNLFQIGADMRRCKVIVSNDSGMMHTAAAVGITVIAIFGSSVREFGFAPYAVKNLILENSIINCRPCSHIGKSECPKKHFRCMIDITPQFVFDKLKNIQAGL